MALVIWEDTPNYCLPMDKSSRSDGASRHDVAGLLADQLKSFVPKDNVATKIQDDRPNELRLAEGNRRPWRWAIRFGILDWFELVALIAIVIMMARSYALLSQPSPADVARCQENLRTIGNALANYHHAFGCYPPVVASDADDRPVHSWRILLLPYFDKPGLKRVYDQYVLDEPWDSETNALLAKYAPNVYRCNRQSIPLSWTTYLAVPVEKSPDGSVRRIAVVEKAASQVQWTELRDASLEEVSAMAGSVHPWGCHGVGGYAQLLLTNGQVVSTDEASRHQVGELMRNPEVTLARLSMARRFRVAKPCIAVLLLATASAFCVSGRRRGTLLLFGLVVTTLLSLIPHAATLVPLVGIVALVSGRQSLHFNTVVMLGILACSFLAAARCYSSWASASSLLW